MAINFADHLKDNVSEIERPPLLPIGTYKFFVEKQPSIEENIADGRFDRVDFLLKCIEATDDVDADALAEYGSLDNTRLRYSFLFNKEDEQSFNRTKFALKRFLTEHLGVDADNASLNEAMAASVNHQCLATVRWRQDRNDPEVQYAEIGSTAPVE